MHGRQLHDKRDRLHRTGVGPVFRPVVRWFGRWMRHPDLVKGVNMIAKAVISYMGGIATFVLVAGLLRGRLGDAAALGIGGLAMLLVGFPFTRYMSQKPVTFRKWALFSALGAVAGAIVFVALGRIG